MMSGSEGEGRRKRKTSLMSHLHTVKAKRRFARSRVIEGTVVCLRRSHDGTRAGSFFILFYLQK